MNKRKLMKTLLAAVLVCASVTFASETASVTVKGNKKSKVYHTAACKHYNAKGSTEEFKSKAEAVKAGYKPCRKCGKAKEEKSTAKSKKKK